MNTNAKKATASRERGKRKPSLLFYADARDSDMRYFSGFNAFDPYLAFSVRGRKIGVAPYHEYVRMLRESLFDKVICLRDVQSEVAKKLNLSNGNQPTICQVIGHLKKEYHIDAFQVGPSFPAGLFHEMNESAIEVSVESNGGLLVERCQKRADEIKALRRANDASAAGFQVVTRTLSESKIKGGKLYHKGRVLTSERLREKILYACIEAGASALHTIASCGEQVVDNHCVGHGPILAGELIIVDIFPQRFEDGYWGDMTRTFLKGRANDAQRRLVNTVGRAHKLAIDMIKPGVRGGKVHEAVQAFFRKQGYETDMDLDHQEGFFHALGHSVGLDIHEEPVMRAGADFRFRKDMVMAVEPGLYYPGLGGARIEDVVHVVPGGNKKISSAPYKWEIA